MINWKVRLKHKGFLMALIALVLGFIYQLASLLGFSLPIAQEQAMQAVGLLLTVLTGLGVVIDPTTKGINDSANAMSYETPRERSI